MHKFAAATLAGVSFSQMLLFAYLGLHSRPMSDDYCRIASAAQFDILEYLAYWRNRVDGSFSDKALGSVLHPLGLEVTSLFPAILIGAWFFSTAALIAYCLQLLAFPRHRRVIALFLSALLIVAISSGLYSEMSLYWYAASLKYSVPMVTLTWFALLSLHTAKQPRGRPRRALFMVAGAALCFASAGFAETLPIVLLVSLSLLLLALWFVRGPLWRRCFPMLLAGWFAALASMLIMLSADGPTLRLQTIRARNPEILARNTIDVLELSVDVWINRALDPAVFASFGLLFAAGLYISLAFAKPIGAGRQASPLPARAPLLFALAFQLLSLPLLWMHHSDDALLLGRFSPAYFAVICCNASLIGALLLLLLQRNEIAAYLRSRPLGLTFSALAIILVMFTLALYRDMHWRAYQYLCISCHSLLFALAWQHVCQLRRRQAREGVIGMGFLYTIAAVAGAAVALAVSYASGKDIPRTFTFAAHLIVWQGLALGLWLVYAISASLNAERGRARWLLQAGALAIMLILVSGIIADQLEKLPKLQLYASEVDQRHERIVQLRATGERRIPVAPLTYDFGRRLGVSMRFTRICQLQYFDIDFIVVED